MKIKDVDFWKDGSIDGLVLGENGVEFKISEEDL